MLYNFDRFCLDANRRELLRDGVPVSVEPKVFDLLVCLVGQRERVVSKDDLIKAVWDGRIVSDSARATCISAARGAFDDTGEEQGFTKPLPRKGRRSVGTIRQASAG